MLIKPTDTETGDVPVSRTSREMLYEGLALLADPIHNYIPFTVPFGKREEATEKELIDSPWMQRLRYINQLQSARWVYPSAEHSRFVHSLGAMHVAGRFARHLYPSLKEVAPDCPSFCLIESLLRVAVLLHDIGHGPFCHFFDDNFLDAFNLTHERLGQAIIRRELAPIIRQLRRSPSGEFSPGETIDPEQVAFLIHKDKDFKTPEDYPRWLVLLKPLFSGIFTADNLDYVLRDSYMCGIAVGPIDLDRLMHYTFFTEQGLTLHKAGLPALTMFLNARSYLYFNVYYHRTTRSLDMHLRDIFRETLKEIFPYNPLDRLDAYVDLTDWSLLLEVKSWKESTSKTRRTLYEEWGKILLRDVKWKMAYDTTFSIEGAEKEERLFTAVELEAAMRKRLPPGLVDLPFRIDMATQDPRPMDPMKMGERQIYVFNPSNRTVTKEALTEYVDSIPAKLIQCRLFALNHDHDGLLSQIAEETLADLPG
ncbi:MAG: HD domain-containing protein [Candidatus Manganitrophaceae bacterium]